MDFHQISTKLDLIQAVCIHWCCLRYPHYSLEFSSAYGFPSVRWGHLFSSMILFLDMHHQRAAKGWSLGSSSINLLHTENRETLLKGVSLGVVGRCEENSSSRSSSSDKPWDMLSVNEGVHLCNEHLCIKSNSYFCRQDCWQLIGLC